ncbi:cytochrome P450 [Cyathus striatus]|nr:cytochrome P450 [Cyathus striatus]
MILMLINALILIPVIWVGWRYIKRYIFRDPLENIPGPPSSSLLKGNIHKVFNANAWQFHKDLAAQYGSVVTIKALLGQTYLYIFDPKAMHHVVVKDQYIYEKMVEGSKLMFGEGLLGSLGDRHKRQRKMLNPVFSIVHMREMIPIFWAVSQKLHDTLASKVKNSAQEIDITHWMTRMALELIGQSGLGYSFDPLTAHGTPHPYSAAVKQLVPVVSAVRLVRESALPTLMKIGPPKFRRWIVDMIPSSKISKLKDIIDIMHNTSVEILESKRKALDDGDEAVTRQVARGKDIMSILIKANMEASEEDRLSDPEILAQMSTFIFAGMDTTSNALSQVQDKLRQEVSQALDGRRELMYDELETLRYLDAVCRETLRLYPPVSQVTRVARQDIILPLHNPIKGIDGKDMSEIYVPKDTHVIVSIIASNRNPDIWGQDAHEWKPERWLSPLPDSVKDAHIPGVYSNLMTFLGGSRACIGFKFSQLEMKVVLAMLLRSFKFAPSEKDIFWAMGGISTPSVVGGDPNIPSLPIIVSLV